MIFHKDFTEKKFFYSAKETAKMFGKDDPYFPMMRYRRQDAFLGLI